MDTSTLPAATPATPAAPRGLRGLWLAYQRHLADDYFMVGIHAWPYLDWRTASGLQWRTRINRRDGR